MQDHQTHYEAVGTLGNLVHSSPEIKRIVLSQGVLQPVINLLQCSCRDSLREAALLIGQFAQCDSRNRNRQPRGEVLPPLFIQPVVTAFSSFARFEYPAK